MKFIRTFENFTEMDMGHQNMEEMCPDCQCKVVECECGSPMAYEDGMEEEYPYEDGYGEEEEEMMSGEEGFPSYFDEEEEEMMGHEEEEEEMMPGEERKMGHIMSFQEAKKAKPDFLDLDKDGDKKESMKKAAADKKKDGKKDDKKEDKKPAKKGGLSKEQMKKLPKPLVDAMKKGLRD
jgi:hypothetical protein